MSLHRLIISVMLSGLWGSAGAGLQVLRQLRWAGARWSGHWRCHGLLALALDAFQTRWLPAPKAWSGAAAATFDGSAYAEAMAAGDHRRARALLPAAALSPNDLNHYLSAALAEDLSIDQLDFLNTAVSEAATQAEWQPYLAAASALIIDQRSQRDVADATRFARGMLG